MKKILALVLVASAFITVSASAQNDMARSSSRISASKQVLVDSLKLSEAAADSVISIRMQSMTQIKTIMSDESLTPDQKKDKIRPIKEDMKKKMGEYLSEEQMKKLMEMQGAMRKERSDEQ